MMHKVLFATPTYDYRFSVEFMSSMMATSIYLTQHGVQVSGRFVGGICFIDLARNDLVKFFLEKTDCTEIFFIDEDVGWDWRSIPRIINSPQEIVAGLVPKRRDENQWHDNALTGHIDEGLLECLEAPTAFMRIKRSVFAKLDAAYPEYKKFNTLEHGNAYFQTGWTVEGNGQIHDFRGEDVFFCRQWVKTGGKIYIDPDVNFTHRGPNAWKGNYMRAGVEMGRLQITQTDMPDLTKVDLTALPNVPIQIGV
jgi:hypothetical protein